jgi:hypothetical protein
MSEKVILCIAPVILESNDDWITEKDTMLFLNYFMHRERQEIHRRVKDGSYAT